MGNAQNDCIVILLGGSKFICSRLGKCHLFRLIHAQICSHRRPRMLVILKHKVSFTLYWWRFVNNSQVVIVIS